MNIRSISLCVVLLFTVSKLFLQTSAPVQTQSAPPVSIQVHASQPTDSYTPILNLFGRDEPNYLYAANGKKLLGELAALSPVPV